MELSAIYLGCKLVFALVRTCYEEAPELFAPPALVEGRACYFAAQLEHENQLVCIDTKDGTALYVPLPRFGVRPVFDCQQRATIQDGVLTLRLVGAGP